MLTNNSYITQVHGFRDLPEDTILALCHLARVVELQDKETLFHQGDMADSFFIIQSGGLRLIENTDTGQDVNLKIYGPGDLFGLLAISGSYPYPSRAMALMDSRVIAIRGEDARQVMLEYPRFGLVVVDLLIGHVHMAHSRIRHLASERVERRVARVVLLYCQKFGRKTEEGVSVGVEVSQQDLADFAAAKVETVNRVLKKWERDGIVRLSRQHIQVLNPAFLEESAADFPM